MTWYQLSVTVSETEAPFVSDCLSTLGALSVTFSDAVDQPIYEPLPGETRVWDETIVTGLFDGDEHLSCVQRFISAQMPDKTLSWRQSVLVDQVWERSWLEHFKPMRFGHRLWVCPSTCAPPDPEAVTVILDPGLAFGTGTHATTALCLEWLDAASVEGQTVVDYGCGSGILAVAALKLGARAVYAVDIDPQALSATRDNAVKNEVDARLVCCTPEQLPVLQADVVIANILAEPLVQLAPQLSALTGAGASLVLSGILVEQAGRVVQAYVSRFELQSPVLREGWARLEGLKHSA